MTHDNQVNNARDDFERAGVCLDEARALRSAGFPYGAASRAYYAVFHGARAMLFFAGLETKSHRAVASLIGEHFVKTGRLSSRMGRILSRMQRDREDADYSTGDYFSEVEADQMIADAELFLAEAGKNLPGI